MQGIEDATTRDVPGSRLFGPLAKLGISLLAHVSGSKRRSRVSLTLLSLGIILHFAFCSSQIELKSAEVGSLLMFGGGCCTP